MLVTKQSKAGTVLLSVSAISSPQRVHILPYCSCSNVWKNYFFLASFVWGVYLYFLFDMELLLKKNRCHRTRQLTDPNIEIGHRGPHWWIYLHSYLYHTICLDVCSVCSAQDWKQRAQCWLRSQIHMQKSGLVATSSAQTFEIIITYPLLYIALWCHWALKYM